ncbi:MAG: hypothetical protein Q4B09_08780 [Lachnospiraceae bacterium]|nr:hypothetical protein [Lachnospiraceae bacterium]
MNEVEAKMQIHAQMIQKFGLQEGSRAAGVISGPIVQDFMQMLKKSPGKPVSEEYRLEDGTGAIRLTGCLAGHSGRAKNADIQTVEIIRY